MTSFYKDQTGGEVDYQSEVQALVAQAELARDAAQLAETNAETAETNAETAAGNAATSATNASNSASAAATSATSAYNAQLAAEAALAAQQDILPFPAEGFLYNDGSDNLSWDTPPSELPADATGVLTNDGAGNLTWDTVSGFDPTANQTISGSYDFTNHIDILGQTGGSPSQHSVVLGENVSNNIMGLVPVVLNSKPNISNVLAITDATAPYSGMYFGSFTEAGIGDVSNSFGVMELSGGSPVNGSLLSLGTSGTTASGGLSVGFSGSTTDSNLSLGSHGDTSASVTILANGSQAFSVTHDGTNFDTAVNGTTVYIISDSVLSLESVSSYISLSSAQAVTIKRYANLSAINAAITAPVADMICQVTGQGLAVYKSGTGWVKASDDTTAIT